jgi:hypothetical protein
MFLNIRQCWRNYFCFMGKNCSHYVIWNFTCFTCDALATINHTLNYHIWYMQAFKYQTLFPSSAVKMWPPITYFHNEIWNTHFQVFFALSYDPTAELHSTWRFELSYSQALNPYSLSWDMFNKRRCLFRQKKLNVSMTLIQTLIATVLIVILCHFQNSYFVPWPIPLCTNLEHKGVWKKTFLMPIIDPRFLSCLACSLANLVL